MTLFRNYNDTVGFGIRTHTSNHNKIQYRSASQTTAFILHTRFMCLYTIFSLKLDFKTKKRKTIDTVCGWRFMKQTILWCACYLCLARFFLFVVAIVKILWSWISHLMQSKWTHCMHAQYIYIDATCQWKWVVVSLIWIIGKIIIS